LFQQMFGMDTICHEFTHYHYALNTPEQFVALQLILDWGLKKSSPILNRACKAMGVSVKPHKQCLNVIQALYLEREVVVAGAPMAVVAQPAPVAVVQ